MIVYIFFDMITLSFSPYNSNCYCYKHIYVGKLNLLVNFKMKNNCEDAAGLTIY